MNNDLISREALKKTITEATYNFEQIPIRVDKVMQIIDNAPTVEPFERIGAICNENCGFYRPQGEWIVEKDSTFEFYKCSNCDAPAEWLDGGSQFLSNFCPNCGADMRGGAEE